MNPNDHTADADSTVQLLTQAERDAIEIPPGDFITEFVDTLRLRTDAAPYLATAGALTALSLAAGDTVTATTLVGGDGPLHFNLYILLVASSTTARKTTILNSVNDLLPTNAHSHERYIVTVDDTSIQAFNQTAAEAGKVQAPVILSVDEAAGLFGEMKRKAGYLAGFDKTLMKVYGHDGIHINRTKSNGSAGGIDAVHGAFVSIFAASTPEPLADVLGADDISSGLLPRFLIFDGDGTTPTTRMSLMDRATAKAEWADRRDVLKGQLFDIARNRAAAFATITDPDGGPPTFPHTTLEWTPEAMARLDELDELITTSRGSDNTDTDAILGRSFEHACKLAGLYALSRAGLDTAIELGDVLRALALVETTSADLLALRHTLGGTRSERAVSAAAKSLDETGRCDLSRLARDLKLTAREGQDVANTLLFRKLAIRDESDILIAPGGLTAEQRRAAKEHAQYVKACTFVDENGDEDGWVSATELDKALGKRPGTSALMDAMVESGDYEDEVTAFPKSRKIRRIA